MSETLVQDLLQAGIHFGQRRSAWNPKMKPYIWGARNKIHIIDIRETVRGLLLAKRFISKTVQSGKDVCFVGTKRQARGSVEALAADANMPWVVERWLGGTLTNFRTIRERLRRLEELEGLVESGEIDSYSKKMTSQLMREKRKITRNLEGIRNMTKLPGAMVVIDTNRETNALREARALKIPTIALIDTDGDPETVDLPIPGNDDSMRSIEVVMRELTNAVREGMSARQAQTPKEEAAEETTAEAPRDPKRSSSRSRFRGIASASATATAEAPAETAEADPVPASTATPPADGESETAS
ncbi:MAG: 30S ribosomal protein S2 [Phycisphaerae bacterium]|nr:30S ribosomal protein S2 [Phycisphaerae bacterium]